MSTRSTAVPISFRAARSLSSDVATARTWQRLSRYELAIGQVATVLGNHAGVFGPQALRRYCKPFYRLRFEQLANLGSGMPDGGAAVLHGMAARRETLVGRTCGIRGHESRPCKGHVELIGRNLQQRRLEALSELGLASEHGDAAIGIDADPGIQKGSRLQAAEKLLGVIARLLRLLRTQQRPRTETHDKRARAGKNTPAGNNNVILSH